MGLETVELILAVEEHFAIEIPDADAEKLLTVGELHQFVVHTLSGMGRPCVPETVYEELKLLILEHLGVQPDEVVPQARFVQDLKAD